ncbi:glycine-rich domain-containing protein [Oscillibacter sp.]|uniref:glycine-rich domain-containing protein n=1 Tax=Oscillibacter sp. TaxID=1945593 RepID=UPI0028962E9A|nr:hypothetical protein [Oscillibacter sp.]
MALNKFEKNMQIIQALDDEPNDVGGMTATELKATFDEGGEAVKEFLNGVLIPALDTYIARVDNPHAVTKAQVGLGNCDNTADTDKPVSVAQTVAIATAKAEAVSVAASDATAKANVAKAEAISASDTAGAATSAVLQHNNAEAGVHTVLFAKKLDKTGGTLTGPLTLSGAPTAALHAASKQYVDGVSAGVVLGQIPDGSITSEKLSGGVNTVLTASTTHAGRTDNPHGVTPAQIGADPSGSAAAVQANLAAHAGRTDNPHGVTAAQIGAATDSSVRDIISRQKWALLASYLTAGAFTFTVPAGYTKLGVYMIGGGGSGASSSDLNAATSTGGASGYGRNVIFDVLSGQQISGVVGAGGIAVNGSSNGNVGGTTSFGGITVDGGNGGKYKIEQNPSVDGSDGGQGSDACGSSTDVAKLQRRLFGGTNTEDVLRSTGSAYTFLRGGRTQLPRESQNSFDTSMVTLCAGGWAGFPNGTLKSQLMIATALGYKGGDGSATNYVSAANAEAGIGPGSGGGGKVFYAASNYGTPYSGAGAPGAVFIYGIKE